MKKLLLAGLMVVAFAGVALAAPNVNVVKVDGDKPVLDGVVNDFAYVAAALANSKIVTDLNWDRGALQDQRSVSYLTYDDTYFYVGTVNYVSNVKDVDVASETWGGADGMEVCWLTTDEIIISVQGFAGGQTVVTMPSGTGAVDPDDLKSGIIYKASLGANYWACEYAIPFKTAGINVKAPLPFNLGAFKKAEGAWEAWIATGGANYNVLDAGTITFK